MAACLSKKHENSVCQNIIYKKGYTNFWRKKKSHYSHLVNTETGKTLLREKGSHVSKMWIPQLSRVKSYSIKLFFIVRNILLMYSLGFPCSVKKLITSSTSGEYVSSLFKTASCTTTNYITVT